MYFDSSSCKLSAHQLSTCSGPLEPKDLLPVNSCWCDVCASWSSSLWVLGGEEKRNSRLSGCCWLRKGNEQAWDRGEQLPPPWLPCFPLHPSYPVISWAVSLMTPPALSRLSRKGLWFGRGYLLPPAPAQSPHRPCEVLLPVCANCTLLRGAMSRAPLPWAGVCPVYVPQAKLRDKCGHCASAAPHVRSPSLLEPETSKVDGRFWTKRKVAADEQGA